MSDKRPTAIRGRRRAAVSLATDEIVTSRPLLGDGRIPLLFTPVVDGVELLAWVTGNRELIRQKLLDHAAVLFRGFAIADAEEFEAIIQALGGPLLRYEYGSTPRSHVNGRIYTSTEYPPAHEIPLHNEMAYAHQWPMKLGFYSVQAAPEGGATPLADSRRIFQRVPRRIRERFVRHGVMYVRNYGQGVDVPWQDVFQTDDPAVVEAFCDDAGITYEWGADDTLRTRQVCQAVATHPRTGDQVWFNQAHLFHVSSLAPDMQRALVQSFGAEGLPRNALYGDGSPIDPADLDVIRGLYQEESIAFPWQDGDVMVLENMLVAHGRRPYSGPRRLVVGMAEPLSTSEG